MKNPVMEAPAKKYPLHGNKGKFETGGLVKNVPINTGIDCNGSVAHTNGAAIKIISAAIPEITGRNLTEGVICNNIKENSEDKTIT
jgi:hypothetical protein